VDVALVGELERLVGVTPGDRRALVGGQRRLDDLVEVAGEEVVAPGDLAELEGVGEGLGLGVELAGAYFTVPELDRAGCAGRTGCAGCR